VLRSASHAASVWFALATSLLTALATAQAPSTTSPAVAPPAESAAKSRDDRAGLSLLASVGYGRHSQSVYRVALEPYAASFGFEPGYTFRNGLRLGAYAQYGLGRSVAQTYDPRIGDSYDLSVKGTSVLAGASLAYDLPLYMFVLRYALKLGFTRLSWEFAEADQVPLAFGTRTGTQYGFSVAPELSLLWRVRAFQCGLAFEYLIQTEDVIPSGVFGRLLVGVAL
jgi:hypothetical protein